MDTIRYIYELTIGMGVKATVSQLYENTNINKGNAKTDYKLWVGQSLHTFSADSTTQIIQNLIEEVSALA